MSSQHFRDMTERERLLVRMLLSPEFPGRDELAEQIETAQVRVVDEDGSFEFSVLSTRSADPVKYVVPVEGEYEDPDGVTVHVLLHMHRSKAKEIEFYREDNATVRTWPKPESMRVFAPQ